MESVTVAFELMKLELEAAVEDLNTQGAELFRCSQYEEAKELTDHGGTLRHFCDRVDELATEWNNNFANVTFSDGTAIAEKTAAQTLVRVLERVGFERVAALGIYVNNENIVSETRSKKYGETEVAKYFIKT